MYVDISVLFVSSSSLVSCCKYVYIIINNKRIYNYKHALMCVYTCIFRCVCDTVKCNVGVRVCEREEEREREKERERESVCVCTSPLRDPA